MHLCRLVFGLYRSTWRMMELTGRCCLSAYMWMSLEVYRRMSSCGIELKKPMRSSFRGVKCVLGSCGLCADMEARNLWRFLKMVGMGVVPGTFGKRTDMM